MPEGWEWDATLFQGSAPFYVTGRPPYAPGLAETIARAVPLTGSERAIDLGCGPGVVALPLASWVAEVVGVDPDPGMLVEAARRAETLGVTNARWIQARAEELPPNMGVFHVAIFAQSFHWMDRPLVAAEMRDLLSPGGALLHIAESKNQPAWAGELPDPRPPYDAIRALTQRWLGPAPRAGQGELRFGSASGEDAIFAAAGFIGPERLIVPAVDPLARDLDAVVAWVYSLSSSAPHLFGAALAAFDTELRALLTDASPTGRFTDPPTSTDLILWRNPSQD